MSKEPLTIPRDKVIELLIGLGINPDMKTLQGVEIDPEIVTVVRYRTDDEGKLRVAGDRVLTETTQIRIGADFVSTPVEASA